MIAGALLRVVARAIDTQILRATCRVLGHEYSRWHAVALGERDPVCRHCGDVQRRRESAR